MRTVPQTTTARKSTHTAHRKAFGPAKHRTPAQKAQDVAYSIAQRNARGENWSYATYGIEDNLLQQSLVEVALLQMAWDAEEEDAVQARYYEEEQARLDDWERREELEVHGRW